MRILVLTSVIFLVFFPVLCSGQAVTGISDDDVYTWTDIKELGVEGKAWKSDALYYNPLPA